MTVYQGILENFKIAPRDICTVPIIDKEPLWFFAYVKNGKLCIDMAKLHGNSSFLVKTRQLKEDECDKMLEIYHRRLKGESVSKEASKITRNQVYWYGIFAELCL